MKITTFDYFVPNYELAQKSAYHVIMNSQLNTIPINLMELIHSYQKHGLFVQTYKDFAKDMDLTIDDVILFCNSTDGCLWKRNDNLYLLLYNDEIQFKGQIRFTLAHELGHFILKHNEQSNRTVISRGNYSQQITDKEYDCLEKEANYFAKRLLAPLPLIDEYTLNFNTPLLTSKLISEIFGTSKEVAKYIVQELNRRNKKTNVIRAAHLLPNNFKEFVNHEFNTKFCIHCHSVSPVPFKYCCICGNNYFIQPTIEKFTQLNYLRKNHSMIYPELKLDKEGRLSEKCPVCENENLHDNYCQICGKDIINKCTGIKESSGGFLTNGAPCKTPLDGDARYCYICGARSTFLENEILPSWSLNSKNYTEENK